MKGKATIEVFDKNGLLKKKIEKENLITNAIDTIINPPFPEWFGCYNNNITPHQIYCPIHKDVLGGIFLFNRHRTEDVNHIIPTSEDITSYVGSAGTNYPNGKTTKVKGSLNLNETGLVENGWKYVWDFNMTGAYSFNSLSLTSASAGNCGLDYDINDEPATKGEIFGRYGVELNGVNNNNAASAGSQNFTNIPKTNINENGHLCFISDDCKTLVFVKSANNAYNLTKYKFKDKIGVLNYFSSISSSDYISEYNNWEKEFIYEVSPTSATIKSDLNSFYWEDNYIYSVHTTYNSADSVLVVNYIKIDVESMTIVDERVFNLSTDTTGINSYLISGNKLLLNDGAKDRILIVNLNNNSIEDTIQYTAIHSSYACYLMKFSDTLIGLYESTSPRYIYLVDLETKTLLFSKLSNITNSNTDTTRFMNAKRIGNSPIYISKSYYTTDKLNCINLNIFEGYLASILNIDTVVKEEEDTLKISYTITN